MNTGRTKQEIRMHIWRLMEERGIARFPRPVYGRIPNFVGAAEAAKRLSSLPEFRRARIVKANPDSPQKWVRLEALRRGKILLMATPRLRSGFLLLDPSRIPSSLLDQASTIRGAFRLGERLPSIGALLNLPGKIDLIVTGSVAVSPRDGARLGKGKGYAELEYAILRELGLVEDSTPIATTVHEIQLVDGLPQDPYDVSVDIIVTPRRTIMVPEPRPRPRGIIWEALAPEKIEEIQLLRELRELGVDR